MHEDTFIAQLHTRGRTYSVQCSDKKNAFRNCASNAAYPSLARVPTQLCRHLCCRTEMYEKTFLYAAMSALDRWLQP